MATISSSNINLATNVRNVLNTAGGSVSDDITTFFKSGANINPFAKYKPVEYASDFIATHTSGTWWKSKDLTCQIKINRVNTLAALENLFLNRDMGWTYKYFTASSTYPWRVGDFRGYNTDAKSVISSIEYSDTVEVTTSGTATLAITTRYRQQSSNELTFAEIAYSSAGNTMDGWYLGFVYKTSKNSTLKIITASSTIDYSDLNETIKLTVSASDEGIVTLYPVMSQSKYTTATSTLNSGTYVCPLPNADVVQVEVKVVVPYTITLNTSSSYFKKSGTANYQFYGTYNIEATQAVTIKGTWYYTAIDSEGHPLGTTIADTKGEQTISITVGSSTKTFTGTSLYFEGATAADFAGFRAEFRSTTTGASFGGKIFKIQ